MNPSALIQSLKNMIVVKILVIFFTCAAISMIIFFSVNYIIIRINIEKIVAQDLQTTADLLYETLDLHFSRADGQWYKFKEFAQTGVTDPEIESRFNDLKYRINQIKILEHGFVFILNTKGIAVVHPEYESKDINEYAYIKEILKKKNGMMEYDLKGKKMLVALKYHAPFEWIIVAGSYYDDFLGRPLKMIILTTLILVIIIGIVVSIVLFRWITAIIIRPIQKAKEIATSISCGDLTVSVDHASQDEVGIMMSAMSDILITQCSIISTLGQHIEKLTNSSEEMASISNKMSKMSQDQAAAMEETSAALEENLASQEQIANRSEMQSQNVDQNAAKMEQMSAEAEGSYKEAIKVNNLMTATAESARLGEQGLEKMVSEMQNIKTSTSKIADIIKIISDISEQVNLLSLNAAIEAARAGEHGRGFAVVADEISKLAEETAQSAKNITRLVSEGNNQVDSGTAIVNRTAQTFQKIIESIDTMRATISKFSQTLKLLADTADETRGNTENIKKMSNEVSLATKEQMSTNKEMSSTVEKVNFGSQELVSHAEVILRTSKEIGGLSVEIKSQLEKFKVR